MTTVPVIRVGEPRELLAYVPYRLGFQPRESVAVVSIRPPRQRIGLVARMDTRDLAHPRHGAAAAAQLAGHVRADGACRVVVVLYTDRSAAAVRAGGVPEAVARDALLAALGPGLASETWVVTSSGYRELECRDPSCCPVDGRPIADLASTALGAHMVFAGQLVAPDRAALRVRLGAPPRARRSAHGAAAAERATLRRVSASGPDALDGWARRLAGLWWEVFALVARGVSPRASSLGRLLVALEDPRARDEILGSLLDAAEVPRLVGGAPGGPAGPPSLDLLRPAKAVLEAVAAHAPRARVAAPLAVLALLCWWEGDGGRANVVLEQCLEADPTERLGVALADVLSRGVAPGWVLDAEDGAESDGP